MTFLDDNTYTVICSYITSTRETPFIIYIIPGNMLSCYIICVLKCMESSNNNYLFLCFTLLWFNITFCTDLNVSRRITYYCVVVDLNLLNISSGIWWRGNITLGFSSNYDAFSSELQENLEEKFLRIDNNYLVLNK